MAPTTAAAGPAIARSLGPATLGLRVTRRVWVLGVITAAFLTALLVISVPRTGTSVQLQSLPLDRDFSVAATLPPCERTMLFKLGSESSSFHLLLTLHPGDV